MGDEGAIGAWGSFRPRKTVTSCRDTRDTQPSSVKGHHGHLERHKAGKGKAETPFPLDTAVIQHLDYFMISLKTPNVSHIVWQFIKRLRQFLLKLSHSQQISMVNAYICVSSCNKCYIKCKTELANCLCCLYGFPEWADIKCFLKCHYPPTFKIFMQSFCVLQRVERKLTKKANLTF